MTLLGNTEITHVRKTDIPTKEFFFWQKDFFLLVF